MSLSFSQFQSLRFDDAAQHLGQRAGSTRPALGRTTHSPPDIEAFDTLRALRQQQDSAHSLPMPVHSVLLAAPNPPGSRRPQQPAQDAQHGTAADDMTYEEMLSLDENNVSRGISTSTQNRVLKPVRPNEAHKYKNTDCVICQERLFSDDGHHRSVTAEIVMIPKCGHAFHKSCIAPWLLRDRTCPTCRTEVHHTADHGIRPR